MITAQRGHIYRIAFTPDTVVLGLIISADRFNERSQEYAALQVSANPVHEYTAAAVRLSAGDPAFGHVICRDIGMIHHGELKEDLGALTMSTLLDVEHRLKRFLGL